MKNYLEIRPLFNPHVHWGVELLHEEVRIVGLSRGQVKHHFVGSHADAAAFAARYGIRYAGAHAVLSHLPLKLDLMEGALQGSDDELRAEEERLRLPGAKPEDMESQPFSWEGAFYLSQVRQELLGAALEALPEDLATQLSLEPTPVALLNAVDWEACPTICAVLWPEKHYTHLLMLREKRLMAYGRLPLGLELAGENANRLRVECRKLLVYYWESNLMMPALEAVFGPCSPAKAVPDPDPDSNSLMSALPELKPLPLKKAFSGVPSALVPATLAASRGESGSLPLLDWPHMGEEEVQERRLWLNRAAAATQAVVYATVLALAGIALLFVGGLALDWWGADKADTYARHLNQMRTLQDKEGKAQGELGRLKNLLVLRSETSRDIRAVAEAMPVQLWFSRWETQESGTRKFQHTLEGYAFEQARVSELLASLERNPRFTTVKLKSTENVSGTVVQERTGLRANRRDLTRFQIWVEN